jgi:hypothetical protein
MPVYLSPVISAKQRQLPSVANYIILLKRHKLQILEKSLLFCEGMKVQ